MNPLRKKLFGLLIGISFLFLVIYLIRQEYIAPELVNLPLLLISFLLLFGGFIAQGYSWKVALVLHGYRSTLKEALRSNGLMIFAKYIPGKIWIILGRAGLHPAGKKELAKVTVVSLKEQLVYLWVGFIVSSIPTILFYGIHWISFLVLVIVTGLSLFLFVPAVHRWINRILAKLFRKDPEIPFIGFSSSLPLILAVMLVWAFWTAGFYCFTGAFTNTVTPVMMFAFPLSVCLGLVAVFLPGGIGLREGVILGYLTLAGMELETAAAISLLNRFWYMGGELFIFLTATVIRLTSGDRSSVGQS